MPAVTLIICVHRQRDLLERLIRESSGCYDDLIVLHDIPDVQDIKSVVVAAGGNFFEREPAFLQEPHWPFAWGQAKHDWILRLDTDEFPSPELKQWLQEFRQAPEPAVEISGYTCRWPLWNGQRTVSKNWPAGRQFLFHKQRVRFFGMCEESPRPDTCFRPLALALCHQPNRKSYGLGNILLRKQSRLGAAHIAKSLLGKPTDFARWRWQDENWPEHWNRIRRHPLRAAFGRLTLESLRTLRNQWYADRRFYFSAAFDGSIFYAMICFSYFRLLKKNKIHR